MAIMNFLLSATLSNWVGKLLEALYNAIGNFGWTVVVFSILLKVILSPLDIWQRVSTKNQQKKMEAIKPKLEKLEKQYKNNPDLLKQKQYEVQREAKINVFATCLPLIVTMVVFFVVFGGFRALVTYENELIVEELDTAYVQYIEDYNLNIIKNEGKEDDYNSYKAAQEAAGKTDVFFIMQDYSNANISGGFVDYAKLKAAGTAEGASEEAKASYENLYNILAKTYEDHLEGDRWLWVKNIFKSDTGTDVVPNLKSYTSSGAGGIAASLDDTVMHAKYDELTGPAQERLNKTGTWDFKNWNGYFILPLLSLLTSFLSTFIMQRNGPQSAVGTQEQQAQQQKQMKMMTYMMPIMLAVFAMLYSAAFAIYYFMSNVMSTLTTLAVNGIMKLIDKKKAQQDIVIVK